MDLFLKEKNDFLGKIDKSKKGSIDKDIIPLVSLINSSPDYYTTSSCAGRIVLIELGTKKNQCNWIISKHSKITSKEIILALKKHDMKNPVWLKQQPLILHVACRDIGKANSLLLQLRKIFKRCGIISITSRKVVVEAVGSENLDCVVCDSNFTVPFDYLKQLVKYSNSNFLQNKLKIKKVHQILKKYMG